MKFILILFRKVDEKTQRIKNEASTQRLLRVDVYKVSECREEAGKKDSDGIRKS